MPVRGRGVEISPSAVGDRRCPAVARREKNVKEPVLLHDSPAANTIDLVNVSVLIFAAGKSCNSTGYYSPRRGANAAERRSPTADGDCSTPRPRTGTGPPRRKVCHPGSPRSSRSHPRSCKSPETATDCRSQILGASYANGLLNTNYPAQLESYPLPPLLVFFDQVKTFRCLNSGHKSGRTFNDGRLRRTTNKSS